MPVPWVFGYRDEHPPFSTSPTSYGAGANGDWRCRVHSSERRKEVEADHGVFVADYG